MSLKNIILCLSVHCVDFLHAYIAFMNLLTKQKCLMLILTP